MKISDLMDYPLPIITDIAKIQPGEAIACEYMASASSVGMFTNLGNTDKDLIELPASASSIDGAFLFICVGCAPDGALKLVADRNVQNFITWETLSIAGYCTTAGLEKTVNELSPQIKYRLPQSEEWDAACTAQEFGGESADQASLWNTAASPSWTSNTGEAAANRIVIGGESVDAKMELVSTAASGFRPVLLYNTEPKVYHRPDEETTCPLPLVADISKIKPGYAISCEYTVTAANTVGTFDNLGIAVKPHISDLAPELPDGTFYFICVGYTPAGDLKLVADRSIQGKVSWEALNAAGFCTTSGSNPIASRPNLYMRLPAAIPDRLVDADHHGEWDAIISYSDLGGVIKASDNEVWNCLTTQSWTLAAPSVVDEAGTAAATTLRIARGGQDKDHLLLRQAKYDTNSINERVGFRPVMIARKGTYFLYLTENNEVFSVISQKLTQAAGDWSVLSDEDKKALFMSAGQVIGAASALKPLTKFKVLFFSEFAEDAKANVSLKALPRDKVVHPKNLISLASFSGINRATVTGKFKGKGRCRMAVTTDLVNYVTWDFATRDWVAIDSTNINEMKANGIDSERIPELGRADWDALYPSGVATAIGFAYLPQIDSIADACEIDRIDLEFGSKGSWDKAIHGTDYTYGYADNVTLSVELKTDGTYKINYFEGEVRMN